VLGLSETPTSVRLAPPLIGQHTAEILREIGLDSAEIEQLKHDGVVHEQEGHEA
jgi:crotonobetainyl-CoA:carnitine CoA-transferase CaiB-like acyl-CoA transferase